MIASPTKNGTHHAKAPRLAVESRSMTMQEFADVMGLSRLMVDNHAVETFDAGMLGVYIMNSGDEVDQAEALLAVLPIARRVFECDSKGGA